MSDMPYLKIEENRKTLMVDGKTFVILGGELHNSSASDLDYMKEHVWPTLRKLGGNCYLAPVYWEEIEKTKGQFDFELVDGLISQAREENVRLVLLWFGLWKNGASTYVPAWMKLDEQYFYMQDEEGRLLESISPFCDEAVDLDKNAFSHLMGHLREYDKERTVLMIQVENEVGVWHHSRDYSRQANEIFDKEIPEEISLLFNNVSGTWEEAFGKKAQENFMAWAFSKAVSTIASAGKKEYPLPMFMNCVPNSMGISNLAGSYPSGGPLVSALNVWKAMAPEIDLYGPDIYIPAFKAISSGFAMDNAFILPETTGDKNCISKALFSVAAYETICFSPFGIEMLMQPYDERDLLAQTNSDIINYSPEAGESLAEAYCLIKALQEEIREAREEKRIAAFLQEGELGEEFHLGDYIFQVVYGGTPPIPWMTTQVPKRREDAPIGGGFILQENDDTFLIAGVSANIEIFPKYGKTHQTFILEKREMILTDGRLQAGRNLNGDERNFFVLGSRLTIQRVKLYNRYN